MLEEGLDKKMGALIVYFLSVGQTLLNTGDKAREQNKHNLCLQIFKKLYQ